MSSEPRWTGETRVSRVAHSESDIRQFRPSTILFVGKRDTHMLTRLLFVSVGVLLACAGCDHATPADTFLAALRKPMPKSVRVINSRSREVTAVDHYLHFTISPEDLAAIVQGGSYERDEKPSLDFHLWTDRPAWWTPEKLGAGAVELSHTPDKEGDAWSRRLFVSASSNEVYCFAAPIFR